MINFSKPEPHISTSDMGLNPDCAPKSNNEAGVHVHASGIEVVILLDESHNSSSHKAMGLLSF